MESKKWYQSKGILVALVIIFISCWNWAIDCGANLPAISEHLYTILGALGLYARKTATTTIGK